MSDVVAQGQKVVLRKKRREDAWLDYEWRTDEELARLDASIPLRLSFREYLRYYEDELRYPTPWSCRYAIQTVEDKYIGNCMCYDINSAAQEAEVGILIGDRNYWGQGYGTDALTALVDHIFDTTSLNRLYLHTLDWNSRARRSFVKCGFQEVRPVRRQGKQFIRMELQRDRWEALLQERMNGASETP